MPGRPSSQGDSQEPKTLPYNDDDDDDQIARRPIHYHVQAKLKDREGSQDDLGKTIIWSDGLAGGGYLVICQAKENPVAKPEHVVGLVLCEKRLQRTIARVGHSYHSPDNE